MMTVCIARCCGGFGVWPQLLCAPRVHAGGGMQCAIAVQTEAGIAAFTFAAVNSR